MADSDPIPSFVFVLSKCTGNYEFVNRADKNASSARKMLAPRVWSCCGADLKTALPCADTRRRNCHVWNGKDSREVRRWE